MVSVAVVGVLKVLAAVTRTTTLWLALTSPALLVKLPPSKAYSPPEMAIAALELMPTTVIASDTTTSLNTAPLKGAKLKALGLVSSATVVASKLALTPPMVSVAVVLVLKLLAATKRTTTC